MNTVLVVTVATYLAINIYPTIKIVKTGENQGLHRLYKIFVIWLIPFVGGLAISLMYIIDPTYGRGPYDVGNGYYENDGSDFGGD